MKKILLSLAAVSALAAAAAPAAAWSYPQDLGHPGQYPFTRGIHPTGYRGKPWTMRLFAGFGDADNTNARFRYLLAAGAPGKNGERHRMVLPAYDQCIKASHIFNLLDARGVISVTERQSYILRVRELAKACGEAFLLTEAGGASLLAA